MNIRDLTPFTVLSVMICANWKIERYTMRNIRDWYVFLYAMCSHSLHSNRMNGGRKKSNNNNNNKPQSMGNVWFNCMNERAYTHTHTKSPRIILHRIWSVHNDKHLTLVFICGTHDISFIRCRCRFWFDVWLKVTDSTHSDEYIQFEESE